MDVGEEEAYCKALEESRRNDVHASQSRSIGRKEDTKGPTQMSPSATSHHRPQNILANPACTSCVLKLVVAPGFGISTQL